MTRPPEKSVPVSERDREMAHEWIGQALTMMNVDEKLCDLLACARHEGRLEGLERAIVIANGACRAGEKCQDDGGCSHVPCLTARMIVTNIRRALALPEGDAHECPRDRPEAASGVAHPRPGR